MSGSRLFRRPSAPPPNAGDAAVWWATRKQSDPAGFAGDRRAFSAWVARGENAAAWARMEDRIAEIGQYASMPEVRDMRRLALRAVPQKRSPIARRTWLGGGALAACLLLGLSWSGTFNNPVFDRAFEAAQRGAVVRYHSTAVGERREVHLEDGSRITLNTASSVEVRYTSARRDIRLTDGQALFRVAKDAARPFVVSAGSRLITATGTAFDVRVQGNGDVSVILVEGAVAIDPIRPSGLARWLPALERERLQPGQRMLIPAAGAASVDAGDIERTTAWDRGQLIFRGDRVADAVAEINRYSARQLVIEDPRIRDLKVSGVFPVSRSEDFVAALEVFYPIQARIGADAITLGWRKNAAEPGPSGRKSKSVVR